MKNTIYPRIISSLILMPIVLTLLYLGDWFFNLLILLIFFLSVLEIFKLKILFYKILIIFILILFLASAYNIRTSENGLVNLFFILILSWLSDIGGYFFGKFIGGKKINIISPNKTYAGFLGSILFSQFLIFYFFYFDVNFFPYLYANILIIIVLTFFVILGDLLFSFFKRQCKIKDYSNLITGHGGLLDRIDGLILSTIVFNLFLIFK